MSRLRFRTLMILGAVVGGLLMEPSTAQARPAASESARVPVGLVVGAGQFRLTEPGNTGDRIWFGVEAAAAADASTHGRFQFSHARPDGTVAGSGWADVTCLQVDGNVALFTAVVPEGMAGDPVKNHAFYIKVIDGGRLPDQIAFVQAQNGPDRPPRRCLDFDVEFPGAASRYPILTGGYLVHGA
jgi:hypothetical protein